eukprot:Plantae.Rhodophyta-Purpureofilum_apyrenoidigerum.ctg26362.p1 GENE.Plantae.Rhodophyta-Purpureofilum_apyrenoidigerum.ctg26362~~Plantae.Rhodophyta-Purpureofilum_apyrenoidigerum.ctg26362.p1  ORF type:complete len:249 (-),score=29.62 Plantae.Rhodophyta-Purpureofilum_apyrenoidigerum.ctg26362:339-1085(-)
MRKQYVKTVAMHKGAEILLLLGTVLGVQIAQIVVLDPITSFANKRRSDQFLFLQHLTISRPPWFLDEVTKPYWRFSSFILWLLLTFGASFLLHLPSLWVKRVQLMRAFTALGQEWYDELKKPTWFPAGYFFPLLWAPVKLIRAMAHSLLWERVGRNFLALPIVLVVVSFVLADMWNQVVFVQHDLTGGLLVQVFQLTLMGLLMSYCTLELPSATKLFVPYTTAVCVSILLNLVLCIHNGGFSRVKQKS